MYYLSVLKEIEKYNKIVVIGYPKSGKTITSNKISKMLNYEVIHTDDYINIYSWADQPIELIKIIKEKEKYIIEGVQGYRVLRTGAKLNIYQPDLVINIISKYNILEKHKAMKKTLNKIYSDYKDIIKYKNNPKIINVSGE